MTHNQSVVAVQSYSSSLNLLRYNQMPLLEYANGGDIMGVPNEVIWLTVVVGVAVVLGYIANSEHMSGYTGPDMLGSDLSLNRPPAPLRGSKGVQYAAGTGLPGNLKPKVNHSENCVLVFQEPHMLE